MIKTENIYKIFNKGTADEVVSIRDTSIEIKKGEFVTVIGTNGSGKTTLLNLIAGAVIPDSGKIIINGKDVTRRRDFERAEVISRVFQNPFSGTAPDMTIAENLLCAFNRGKRHLPLIKLNKKLIVFFKERLSHLEMKLEDRIDSLIGSLSGGQRQAITLLMAVINEPQVLLLDEHTAALDPKSAGQIIKLTRRFIESPGLTVLMVTHSMNQALELGSRIIMMHNGEIIDDISGPLRQRLTTDDLLYKFAEVRKKEMLTDELFRQFANEYV